ncbi:MAG: YheT family hydrolase [Pseudomonadota bacterium]
MIDGFPAFRPRPPWLTGDLQTLRNFLRRPRLDLSAWPRRRLELPMRDGSGDRLVGELNSPPTPAGKPLVVLVHGLSGCAESPYVLASARHFLGLGHAVLRLNLRGAGASRALCRFQYHGGRSADFAAALSGLDPDLLEPGVFAVGYSLGANMVLKYLAEAGAKGPVRAAAAVSAPIDLKAASLRLMARRNLPYALYLLGRMRLEALAPAAEINEAQRSAVLSARTVYEFDDVFTAPRNGFNGAEEFYEKNSARVFLHRVGVPTLIVCAKDDPWIPASAYQGLDWRANANLVPLLPEAGGHVGFHGQGSRTPWSDLCIARFFDRVAS